VSFSLSSSGVHISEQESVSLGDSAAAVSGVNGRNRVYRELDAHLSEY